MANKEVILHKIKATLRYTTKPGKKWLIANCTQLKISSQGLTEVSAYRNLRDAIALTLKNAIRKDVLEDFLQECGFNLEAYGSHYRWVAQPTPEKGVSYKTLKINRLIEVVPAKSKAAVKTKASETEITLAA